MNGLDKITAKINADADAQVRSIQDKAKAQSEEIMAQGRERAEKEKAELLARGQRAAEERKERLISAAHMEGQKKALGAKQEVLDEAFTKALEKMCSLPEKQYQQLLTRLAVQAATTGSEQIIFSKEDRGKIGKSVVAAANKAIAQRQIPPLPDSLKGARKKKDASLPVAEVAELTLAEETRPIRAGFIMTDGPVEVNCTFDTMVRAGRDSLEKQTADILFRDQKQK